MKVSLCEEERYPVYTVDADDSTASPADVPEDIIARYHAAQAEWEAVQEVLRPYVDAAIEAEDVARRSRTTHGRATFS